MLAWSLPHSYMDQHLTVKEAVKLTGKSESTIKRLIREIVNEAEHADRDAILPLHAEMEQKRKAGEPYVWKIDRQLLQNRFPPDDSESNRKAGSHSNLNDSDSAPIIEVLREQLQSKDRQLATLETQLDRKDQQIGALNERMRESNILMKELQEKVAIAAPAASVSEEAVDAHQTRKERSDSRWKRPLQLFRKTL